MKKAVQPKIRLLYLTGVEILCSTVVSTVSFLFLPALMLSGWRDIFPLAFEASSFVRFVVAAWLVFVGCSALARTIGRLLPVAVNGAACVVPYTGRDLRTLACPYGVLCVTFLGALFVIGLTMIPAPVQGLLVVSLLVAIYRRRLTRGVLEQGDFFLYLRHFGSFREQLVLGELLGTVPQGTPVVVLVPPAFEAASWDPLVITWKGVARRDSLRGGPFYVRAEGSIWISAVEELIARARMVIMDVSDYTGSIDYEYRAIIARRLPEQVVLVADITSDFERAQEAMLREWDKQMSGRQKEISGWYEKYIKNSWPDRGLIVEALANQSAEVLNPAWPVRLRMYGRSQLLGIFRSIATLFICAIPMVTFCILLAFLLAANIGLPSPRVTWLISAILLPTLLQVISKWHLLFRRSVDLELRRVLKQAFNSSGQPAALRTLRGSGSGRNRPE